MTTLSEIDRVQLNGVINTGQPVMANLENIANTSYTWITYDITTGKWSVVINQPGSSTKSFDDDNIIGAVDLTTTPLDKMYNGVEVQFPDFDINDSNRFVRAQLNEGEYNSNEQENILRLTYPLIHDQIQALHLGLTELKQSRLDKVVAFNTNYSSYGVRAGDIIDVTADTYGWTAKLFRVLQVEEIDTTAGGIELRITAQEYSDSIYEHDLSRFTLSNNDGIFALGDIGPMSQPVITVTNVDERPNILIESEFADFGAPVTGVEIWAYPVTEQDEIDNWNNPLIYPDSERQYNLVETKQSSEETYTLGDPFDHTIYDLNPGNWLIKLRPINALTKGPFTTPGALTVFDPDVAGGVLTAGNLLDQNISVMIYAATFFIQGLEIRSTFYSTPDEFGSVAPFFQVATDSFVAPASNRYKIDWLVDPGNDPYDTTDGYYLVGGRWDGSTGFNHPFENEAMNIMYTRCIVRDSSNNVVSLVGSGGPGHASWQDFVMADFVDLIAGETYTVSVEMAVVCSTRPNEFFEEAFVDIGVSIIGAKEDV